MPGDILAGTRSGMVVKTCALTKEDPHTLVLPPSILHIRTTRDTTPQIPSHR